MKIACLCCTYKRPQQLAEAVESFVRQTYPAELRELIILDDVGQYDDGALNLPNVKLISFARRFRTLGEKRNATAALASPDAAAYAVWDDDDIYLPWHLEAVAGAFEAGHKWFRPEDVWVVGGISLYRKRSKGCFHGSWAFTREAFLSVGGYPACNSGEDQILAYKLNDAGIKSASEADIGHEKYIELPGYIYRWFSYSGAAHVSAHDGMYEELAGRPFERVSRIEPMWTRDWVEVIRNRAEIERSISWDPAAH